jgi:hypothetical protein
MVTPIWKQASNIGRFLPPQGGPSWKQQDGLDV